MEESERYGRDCPLEKKFRLEGGGERKRGYCKANNGIKSYAIPYKSTLSTVSTGERDGRR